VRILGLLVVPAAAAALALGGLGGSQPAAAAAGDSLLARAEALSQQWGRCPTARPAHRVLAEARRTSEPRPRVRRARAALRAWSAVAQECARPVPQPTVSPGS
jgi:hypothetical protein